MKVWLEHAAGYTIIIFNAMALVVIAIGSVQAFTLSICSIFSPSVDGRRFRHVYMRYGRWLVGGLTFQLAADIIETSILPTWVEIGRLGSIAVIRAFINYFLDHDLIEMERLERRSSNGHVEN